MCLTAGPNHLKQKRTLTTCVGCSEIFLRLGLIGRSLDHVFHLFQPIFECHLYKIIFVFSHFNEVIKTVRLADITFCIDGIWDRLKQYFIVLLKRGIRTPLKDVNYKIIN